MPTGHWDRFRYCLVATGTHWNILEHVFLIFPEIFPKFIIPTDELIVCQRGRYTTNQIVYKSTITNIVPFPRPYWPNGGESHLWFHPKKVHAGGSFLWMRLILFLSIHSDIVHTLCIHYVYSACGWSIKKKNSWWMFHQQWAAACPSMCTTHSRRYLQEGRRVGDLSWGPSNGLPLKYRGFRGKMVSHELPQHWRERSFSISEFQQIAFRIS